MKKLITSFIFTIMSFRMVLPSQSISFAESASTSTKEMVYSGSEYSSEAEYVQMCLKS